MSGQSPPLVAICVRFFFGGIDRLFEVVRKMRIFRDICPFLHVEYMFVFIFFVTLHSNYNSK